MPHSGRNNTSSASEVQQTIDWDLYPHLTDECVGEVSWELKRHQGFDIGLPASHDCEWEVFSLVYAERVHFRALMRCPGVAVLMVSSQSNVRVLGVSRNIG